MGQYLTANHVAPYRILRSAVQRALNTTVQPELCVTRVANGVMVEYILENLSAGHSFPSGAAMHWVGMERALISANP